MDTSKPKNELGSLVSSQECPNAPKKTTESVSKTDWERCPEEIKTLILKHLAPQRFIYCISKYNPERENYKSSVHSHHLHFHHQRLLRISMASREFYRLCAPLYHESVMLKNARQLCFFFRTLCFHPELRPYVRNLAWLGKLPIPTPGDRVRERARIREQDRVHGRVRPPVWPELQWLVEATCPWPKTTQDRTLFQCLQLNKRDLTSFDTWKIFAAVLGMVPRLQNLTLTHVDTSRTFGTRVNWWTPEEQETHHLLSRLPASLEHTAIRHLLSLAIVPGNLIPNTKRMPEICERQWEQTLNQMPVNWTRPRYLQGLESISFVPDEPNTRHVHSRALSLRYLLLNCPVLKRVELHGSFIMSAVNGTRLNTLPNDWEVLPNACGAAVEELILRRWFVADGISIPPTWSKHMVRMFPNLQKLWIDVGEGPSFWARSNQLRSAQELSRLGPTLKSLTMTSFRCAEITRYDLNPPVGYISSTLDGALQPVLPSLTSLTHLVTDCGMLFGSQRIAEVHAISRLLPASLVHFHLIDFWGMSPDQAISHTYYSGPNAAPPSLRYYPHAMLHAGGGDLTPSWFMKALCDALLKDCKDSFPSLRTVTVSSPYHDTLGRWGAMRDWQMVGLAHQIGGKNLWSGEIRESFAERGITFSITSMTMLDRRFESVDEDRPLVGWDSDGVEWPRFENKDRKPV